MEMEMEMETEIRQSEREGAKEQLQRSLVFPVKAPCAHRTVLNVTLDRDLLAASNAPTRAIKARIHRRLSSAGADILQLLDAICKRE